MINILRSSFNVPTFISRTISLSAERYVDVPSSKPLKEERKIKIEQDIKDMQWRQKPHEQKGAWYSKFKVFLEDDDEVSRESLMTRVIQPLDLRPKKVKEFFVKHAEEKERFLQQFIPDRHEILGNDLAAAHFILFRFGQVKFKGQNNWMKADSERNFNLPDKYVSNMFLEAIDCENMTLYYEGLDNIRRLKHLRYLSFKNVKKFDDWCLDRVSSLELDNLSVLILSGTEVTFRGLGALYRIPSLKRLTLDKPYRDPEWKLTIAMLQDILPELEIIESTPPIEKIDKK
ncbi:CLUMA_CG015848, isoform A [Clunio marinus]|uniref:CLUMA_CG015848, isoform A n=1 Tax=Clunio marinus TaxID=568069 RepID=A0A1J1IQY1_9DIPT|nr:CLUMA_CG015848, isoform A [Clunio marinus]